MSKFPLYDNLNKNLPKKNLTIKQKKEFVLNIESFDYDTHEIIYVIIKYHQLENNDEKNSFVLPYDGIFNTKNNETVSGCDINFDFEKLPIKLQHILYKFMLVHKDKLENDIDNKK